MKSSKMIATLTIIAALCAIFPGVGLAAEDTAKENTGKEEVKTAETPIYKPPKRGAPGGRLGGGTRGEGDGMPAVAALVPDHVGLTSREQPTLCWFLSGPTNHPVELSIIEAQAVAPMVESRLDGPSPGVQCIDLADLGARLKPSTRYQWFVAIVPDPDRRSRDVLSGGEIERVDLPSDVERKLSRGGRESAPFVYAEAGLWYDALAAASKLVAESSSGAIPRKQRAALLRQVGLTRAADFDSSR